MEKRTNKNTAGRLLFLVLLTAMIMIMCAPAAFAAKTKLIAKKKVTGDGLMSAKKTCTVATYVKKGRKVKNKLVTLKVKGKYYKYYFNKKGVAATGSTRYFEGMPATRFLKVQKVGKYYYAFDENAHAVTGVQVIMKNFNEGKLYFFDRKGRYNVVKTAALRKAVRQSVMAADGSLVPGTDIQAALDALKKYGAVPVSDPVKTEVCLGVYTSGFDIRFRGFVLHGMSDSASSIVYNFTNAVN